MNGKKSIATETVCNKRDYVDDNGVGHTFYPSGREWLIVPPVGGKMMLDTNGKRVRWGNRG